MRYLLLVLLLAGCPLHNPVPVEPDYPSGNDIVVTYPDESPLALSSPCGRSCANFRNLGCSDGETLPSGVTCYQACSRMVRVRRVPAACWIAADTLDHLRACGPDVRCVR
jgi:hypothetical protein